MRVIRAAANDHQMRRRLENDIYLASWASCVEICAIMNMKNAVVAAVAHKLPLLCCYIQSQASISLQIILFFSGNHGDTPTVSRDFL